MYPQRSRATHARLSYKLMFFGNYSYMNNDVGLPAQSAISQTPIPLQACCPAVPDTVGPGLWASICPFPGHNGLSVPPIDAMVFFLCRKASAALDFAALAPGCGGGGRQVSRARSYLSRGYNVFRWSYDNEGQVCKQVTVDKPARGPSVKGPPDQYSAPDQPCETLLHPKRHNVCLDVAYWWLCKATIVGCENVADDRSCARTKSMLVVAHSLDFLRRPPQDVIS